jgi:hypothetical protein
MVSLYIAIKLHESVVLEPRTIASLSGGAFTRENVEEMELSMLQKLDWRMNPPTSMEFARQYVELLGLDKDQAAQVLETTSVQLQAATRDYDLSVRAMPSRLAFCALANSLLLTDDHQEQELQQLARICGIQLRPSCRIQRVLHDKLMATMKPVYMPVVSIKSDSEDEKEEQYVTGSDGRPPRSPKGPSSFAQNAGKHHSPRCVSGARTPTTVY